MQKGGHQTATA